MTSISWEDRFTCKWTREGKLDNSGFPDDTPTCLRFYLLSIRPEKWPVALRLIQDGEGHCFFSGTGISFPLDYESSSSDEDYPSRGPLPEDEVEFFAEKFEKNRIKRSLFLRTVEKCLAEHNDETHGPLDGKKEFLDYIREETEPAGDKESAAGPESAGPNKSLPADEAKAAEEARRDPEGMETEVQSTVKTLLDHDDTGVSAHMPTGVPTQEIELQAEDRKAVESNDHLEQALSSVTQDVGERETALVATPEEMRDSYTNDQHFIATQAPVSDLDEGACAMSPSDLQPLQNRKSQPKTLQQEVEPLEIKPGNVSKKAPKEDGKPRPTSRTNERHLTARHPVSKMGAWFRHKKRQIKTFMGLQNSPYETKEEREVRENLTRSNAPLNVLVIGRPGVGKSTFINSMQMAFGHQWRQLAKSGRSADGNEPITDFFQKYEMFSDDYMAVPVAGYKHKVCFWDCSGFTDDGDDVHVEFIGRVLEGFVPDKTRVTKVLSKQFENEQPNKHKTTENSTNWDDEKDKDLVDTLRRSFSQIDESRKFHRLVLVLDANQELPTKLMEVVRRAAKLEGRAIPIFLLMSKVDTINNKGDYQQRKTGALAALGLTGEDQQFCETSLYCNAGCKRNRSGRFIPARAIDKKLMRFCSNLTDPCHNPGIVYASK